MKLYLALALGGIPIGAMYALQALGIVLVYKTSRVFNFSTGAIGLSCAYLASTLTSHGVPVVIALLLSVALGVVIGVAMEISTRPVDGTLTRTIVTLGWLLAMQGLVGLIYGTQEGLQEPAKVLPGGVAIHSDLLNYGWSQVTVIVVTAALVAGLAWFFRTTALGTATRAVSETPDAARLLGISVNRVNLVAWGIGGATSGLAGVLITPLLGKLDTTTLVIFTVQALAAALVGRLTSIPLTLLGGIGLGMAQPVVRTLAARHLGGLPGTDEVIALLVVLVALLLFRREGRRDVLGGGLPPVAVRELPRGRLALALAVGVVLVGVVLPLLVDDVGNLSRVTLSATAVWSIAVLSLVLLVGVVGQVSVCQAVFMGVGAFGTGIAMGHSVPFLLAVPIGALLAAAVAVLVGLPAVRLEPLELAIATLALAFTADRFLYSWEPFASSSSRREVPRPGFANLHEGHASIGERNYAWLVFAVFVALAFGVASLRRGRTGAALTALRSSEPAASAMGFSVASAKLRGFAASGFVAGIAGALYAGLQESASGSAFDFSRSITLLAFAVIVGVGSVPAAVLGGMVISLSTLTLSSTHEVSTGRGVSASTLVTGVVLIGVLAVAPQGIAGLLQRLRRRPAPPVVSDEIPHLVMT
ncbi:MAG: transporter related protein [Frankiales bacterium]|nr:transporter related protein [Frankiales bacterium]